MNRRPLRQVNPERKAKLEALQFGPQAELCRRSKCSVRSCSFTKDRIVPHHLKSRAAGGLDEDTVPLCMKHHAEIHTLGRRRFEERYGLDLFAVRDRMRELVRCSPDSTRATEP